MIADRRVRARRAVVHGAERRAGLHVQRGRVAAGALHGQNEIDYYWGKLSNGGDPNAQQCGWLKDRFGLSWQVVPAALPEMLKDSESPGARRVMDALMRMKKIDLAELERAFGRERVTA